MGKYQSYNRKGLKRSLVLILVFTILFTMLPEKRLFAENETTNENWELSYHSLAKTEKSGLYTVYKDIERLNTRNSFYYNLVDIMLEEQASSITIFGLEIPNIEVLVESAYSVLESTDWDALKRNLREEIIWEYVGFEKKNLEFYFGIMLSNESHILEKFGSTYLELEGGEAYGSYLSAGWDILVSMKDLTETFKAIDNATEAEKRTFSLLAADAVNSWYTLEQLKSTLGGEYTSICQEMQEKLIQASDEKFTKIMEEDKSKRDKAWSEFGSEVTETLILLATNAAATQAAVYAEAVENMALTTNATFVNQYGFAKGVAGLGKGIDIGTSILLGIQIGNWLTPEAGALIDAKHAMIALVPMEVETRGKMRSALESSTDNSDLLYMYTKLLLCIRMEGLERAKAYGEAAYSQLDEEMTQVNALLDKIEYYYSESANVNNSNADMTGLSDDMSADPAKKDENNSKAEYTSGDGWDTPEFTFISAGNTNELNATVIPTNCIGKVLHMKNRVGGWFSFVAPKSGDYTFTVDASKISDESFSMVFYSRVPKRHKIATLKYFNSPSLQSHTLENVEAGTTLYWWDNDNSGRGYTALGEYDLRISVQESTQSNKSDYVYSVLDNNTISITNYIGNDAEIVIPSEIDGKKVTDIAKGAFFQCYNLTSVTIPDGVTSIGDDAFQLCSNLTDVTIPDSVKSIGKFAFCQCSSLINITIPDSVKSIDDYAFCHCVSLTSVTLPDDITSIDFAVFYNCPSLTSIIIPDSVALIDMCAFEGCSSLTSITIPGSVENIDESAFAGCSSLTSITIPDSVKNIGMNAFEGCSSLTNITIPDSVKRIGTDAYKECDRLETIYVQPNSYAEEWAFNNWYNVQYID